MVAARPSPFRSGAPRWHLARLLVLLLAFAAAPAGAQTSGAPQSLLPQGFQLPAGPDEAALIAREGFPPEQVGLILFDVASGQVVVQHNADRLFIPASVEKIPTLMAALLLLGPEHRFETSLLMRGKVAGGALAGDLWLKGGGDPFLLGEELLPLVQALRGAGIGAASGFHYDESALPLIPVINPQQPLAVPYNPGLSALGVNFNEVRLVWSRKGPAPGTAVSRSDLLEVTADGVSFDWQAEPRRTAPFLLDSSGTGERWLVSPLLPRKGEARLPVRQPGRNAALVFRRLAADQGVALPEPTASAAPADARALATRQSQPLGEIARLILRWSNNLSAEIVGLAASTRLGPTPKDLAASGARLAAWLKSSLPAVDWSGFVAANHSGLSADSRMSARQMAAILAYGQQRLELYGLLAPVRWTGELNQGRSGAESELAVRAKSGTLNFARGLAGFTLTDRGRLLGFVVFIGDLGQRAAYDAAMDVEELAAPPGAREWMKRARALEQALVSRWAKAY